jgi:hypothetical protein
VLEHPQVIPYALGLSMRFPRTHYFLILSRLLINPIPSLLHELLEEYLGCRALLRRRHDECVSNRCVGGAFYTADVFKTFGFRLLRYPAVTKPLYATPWTDQEIENSLRLRGPAWTAWHAPSKENDWDRVWHLNWDIDRGSRLCRLWLVSKAGREGGKILNEWWTAHRAKAAE